MMPSKIYEPEIRKFINPDIDFISSESGRYINELFKFPSNKIPSLEERILAGDFKPK